MADAYSTGLSAVQPLSVRDAAGLIDAMPPQPDNPDNDDGAQEVEGGAPGDFRPTRPPADTGAADDVEAAPDEERDAAPEEAPGDDEQTKEEDDSAEDLPPIDPPRSWTREDKELWKGLPRETQERLAERERSRETDFLRRQNEATEARKAATAEAQQAQQARDQYKAGLDQLSVQLGAVLGSEFSDIKTWEDVRALSREDPVRHGEWQAAYDQYQAVQQEQGRVAQEQQQQTAQQFQEYVAAETQRFLENAPEFADQKQAPQLQAEVRSMLVDDYRIAPEELNAVWNGAPMSFHDHRVQLIVRDALRYRQVVAKASTGKTKAPPKPASPPPQRPGTQPAKGEVKNQALDRLDKKLSSSNSRADALALMAARRQAPR